LYKLFSAFINHLVNISTIRHVMCVRRGLHLEEQHDTCEFDREPSPVESVTDVCEGA